MSEEEILELEERIARGAFRFGDTLRLKHLKRVEESKKARELLKAGIDPSKLYAYAVSLEKRIEALEELLQTILNILR